MMYNTTGNTWSLIIFILLLMGVFIIVIKMLRNAKMNRPTWKGIIISALLGILPFYLVMCFLGIWGEEEDK